MKEKLDQLLNYALKRKATDIHFKQTKHILQIQLRIDEKIVDLKQDLWDSRLFSYIKFLSGMDLTNPNLPQSGQFSRVIDHKQIFFRFSVLSNSGFQTGVLRILNTNPNMTINELTSNFGHRAFLNSLVMAKKGLIIACGPTNSGKTTTLHAILHAISLESQHKVVSLEDPIEIEDKNYLQLQINEEQGFTFEKGIEELLRHDPDVILIGETRNAYTAKMVVRTALSGSLAFTTLHASNALEGIQRLYDLGISKFELKNTLTCLLGQRLYSSRNGKECIYEILHGKDLQYVLDFGKYPENFCTLADEIYRAVKEGKINDPQANWDIADFKR